MYNLEKNIKNKTKSFQNTHFYVFSFSRLKKKTNISVADRGLTPLLTKMSENSIVFFYGQGVKKNLIDADMSVNGGGGATPLPAPKKVFFFS